MSFPIALRLIVTELLFVTITVLAAPKPIPAPSTDVPLANQAGKETAVFAGGCFWECNPYFSA